MTIMEDQRIIAAAIDSAGSTVSGMGEHDLASQLWQLGALTRSCAARGHRYVRCRAGCPDPEHFSLRHCVMHHDGARVPAREDS